MKDPCSPLNCPARNNNRLVIKVCNPCAQLGDGQEVGVLYIKQDGPLDFVCSQFALLRNTAQRRRANVSVSNPNSFSKFVSANKLATVFRTNSRRKIHNIISTVLSFSRALIYLPFINKIEIKNRLMVIDIVSNRYICSSFWSRPPQAIL